MPVHGSVAAVLRRQRRGLDRFMYDEGERVGAIVAEEVADRTPVGRVIDDDTGQDLGPSGDLRDSWYAMQPHRVRGNVVRAGAANELDYASYVNDGTRRHVIRGNLYLRFWSQGKLWIRRQVNHPGTEPVFMAERGLAAADVRWEAEGERRLQAWLNRTDRGR